MTLCFLWVCYKWDIVKKQQQIYNDTKIHISEEEKEVLRNVFGFLPPIFGDSNGLPLSDDDQEGPQTITTKQSTCQWT